MVDEAGDIKDAATVWEKRLSPALADKQGWALFGGSPQGRNWFYGIFRGAGSKPGWSRFLTTTAEGGLVAPEEIEERRANMDARHFASEFEASFDNQLSGRVYYAYGNELNQRDVEYNPALSLAWTMDFNIGFMCSVIAQSDGSHINVLEELALPDTNLTEMCAEFIRRVETKYLPFARRNSWESHARITVELYGDSTGKNRTHAGPSDWNIVRESLGRVPWLTVENKVITNPLQKDRVNSVNAMLCSAAGERRLFIHPSCKELDADLDQVQWAEDSAGNIRDDLSKKDPKRTHISDALGYYVWAKHGIKAKASIGSGFIA
jgi:hypothetical protein